MQNGDSKQIKMVVRKSLRLRMDPDVIRLVKSKAASQEVTIWWVAESLFRMWVRGDITIKSSGGKNGK